MCLESLSSEYSEILTSLLPTGRWNLPSVSALNLVLLCLHLLKDNEVLDGKAAAYAFILYPHHLMVFAESRYKNRRLRHLFQHV